MDLEHISRNIDALIAFEDLPARADIKPVSRFDEVIEDTDWDFINWFKRQEFLLLLGIRKRPREEDFWEGWV